MDTNVSAFNVAVVHTLFNIASTVILMPFCKFIETLAIRTIKENKKDKDGKINAGGQKEILNDV